MTTSEFSNEFDVIYNSITSNQAPGLDEYEKSVFLTRGQYDVLYNYLNPKGNKFIEGFDGSKKRQADFSNLMSTVTLSRVDIDNKFDDRSICYIAPPDLFVPINESAKDNNYKYVVTPITFDEYDRLMSKPYQYPVKKHIWRLFTSVTDSIPNKVSATITDWGTIDSPDRRVAIKNSSDKTVVFKVVSTPQKTSGVDIRESYDKVSISLNIDNLLLEEFGNNTYDVVQEYLVPGGDRYDDRLNQYIGDMSSNDSCIPDSFIDEVLYTLPENKDTTIFSITAAPAIPSSPVIELIGKMDKPSFSYSMRYIRKARPIVLEDLGDLSIDGVSTKTECELDSELHREILQRAVELAKASYTGDLQSQLILGQTSQTDIGTVSSGK